MTRAEHVVDISTGGGEAIAAAVLDGVEADAHAAMAVLLDDPAELSIVLCDDATMAPLNQQWRGKEGPTDVLSFPQEEGEALALPPGMPRQLGDLVISVDTAARQADELGHDLRAELQVLVVHGLLHLLGYDHETGSEDAAVMRAEEDRVLTLLGGGRGLVGR